MKNNEFLFEAIGGLDDELVISAAERIREAKPVAPFKKSVRIILIDAAVIALIIMSAFALDLFGLRALVTKINEPASENKVTIGTVSPDVEQPQRKLSVTPYGVVDSAEYLATSKWAEFAVEYERIMSAEAMESGKTPDAWREENSDFCNSEEEWQISNLYYISDQTMLDKLIELSEKYSLDLLKTSTSYHTMSELCAAAKVGEHMRNLDGFSTALCFEDGSFKERGSICIDEKGYFYELYCVNAGFVYPVAWAEEDNWEAWAYTTRDGYEVTINFCPEASAPCRIAFAGDGRFFEMEVGLVSYDGSDYHAICEQLADCVMFGALFDYDESMAESFAAEAGRTAQHVPDETAEEEQFVFTRGKALIDENTDAEEYLSDFLNSGEYQASLAMSREYGMTHGWESELHAYSRLEGEGFEKRAQELKDTYGLVSLFHTDDPRQINRTFTYHYDFLGRYSDITEQFETLWQGCFIGELFPVERETCILVTSSRESLHSALSISNESTGCCAYAIRRGCMMLTQDEADLKITAIDSAWIYSADGCLVCCGTQEGVGSIAVYETEWGWYMLCVDGGREELESALSAMDFTQTR